MPVRRVESPRYQNEATGTVAGPLPCPALPCAALRCPAPRALPAARTATATALTSSTAGISARRLDQMERCSCGRTALHDSGCLGAPLRARCLAAVQTRRAEQRRRHARRPPASAQLHCTLPAARQGLWALRVPHAARTAATRPDSPLRPQRSPRSPTLPQSLALFRRRGSRAPGPLSASCLGACLRLAELRVVPVCQCVCTLTP